MSLIGRVIGRTEDKVMEKFLAKYLAGFFERTCGSYITTIIGIGIMVLGAVNQFGAFIPTQYHALVNVAVLVLTAMLGILAHDSKDDVTIPLVKPLAAFVICLLVFGISSDAHAQAVASAPAPSIVFTGGTAVVAFDVNGKWVAGAHVTQTFDLYDKGGNSLFVAGHQLIPGDGSFQGYLGGAHDEYAVPKFGNLAAGALILTGDVAIGSTVTSAGAKFAQLVNGGLKVNLGATGVGWQAFNVGILHYSSTTMPVVSSGLTYIF